MMANTGDDNSSKKNNFSHHQNALMGNNLDEGYKSGIIVNKNIKHRLESRKTRIGVIHKTPPKENSQGIGTQIRKRDDHDY